LVKLVSISQALLVAEHLSFSRAAQVLGIQQSAVSRRVRALEDKLGVSLFERDASGIRLTEAGRRFLDRSRSALAEIDHAVKGAANAGCGAEGALRIGILSSLSGGFVRELLRAYRETHPAIAIDIVEGSASEHLARISERLLDIAFVTGAPSALRVGRSANDAGDFDGDLDLAEIGEGIVSPGVVVERRRAAIGGEIVGA
jgi:DNA-binding transcriptional LysR family regulator